MAKMIVDAAGISTISGAMLKPKKIEGHNHGNYLVAVHRVAPTTNPNCQRIYSKRPDAYKRSTPVSVDERAHLRRTSQPLPPTLRHSMLKRTPVTRPSTSTSGTSVLPKSTAKRRF